MHALDTLCDWITKALAALSGLFLVLMMALACANMTTRAFGVPIEGTFELMGFFGAIVAAFSLGFAQRNRSHIAVGLLVKHFPKPVRRLLDALAFAASSGFFALCGWETWKWAWFLVDTGEVSENLRIVYHPFVFAAALGCAAMAAVLLVDTLKSLFDKRQPV